MPARPRIHRPGSRLRPVVATAEVVGFSALAHTAAGGSPPGLGLLAALTVLVLVTSLALRYRLLDLRRTAGVVVAAEVGLHVLFSAGGAHGTHGTHGVPGQLAGPNGGMLLAHGLSAFVTVLALVWQEQVLVTVADWLIAARPFALVLRRQDHRLGAGRLTTATWDRMVGCLSRRGPPVVPAT